MVARVGRVNLLQECSIDGFATHGSIVCPPAKHILVTLGTLRGFSKVCVKLGEKSGEEYQTRIGKEGTG